MLGISGAVLLNCAVYSKYTHRVTDDSTDSKSIILKTVECSLISKNLTLAIFCIKILQ